VQQPVYVAQQQPGVPGAAPPAGFQPGFAPPAGFAPPPGGQPVVGQPFGQPGVIPQPGMVPNFAADQPLQVFPGNEPYVIVDVDAEETQTGRLMIGAGVNSNAGLVGNIVVDEQNFDLFRLPQSWDDIRNGTAFRRHAAAAIHGDVPGAIPVRHPDRPVDERILLHALLLRLGRSPRRRPHRPGLPVPVRT
jgi:hypothetical protein